MANDKLYIEVFNNGTNDLYIRDAEAQEEITSIKNTIKNGSSYIGKFVSAVIDGQTVDTIAEGDAPTSVTTTKGTFVPGTPASGQEKLNAGDYVQMQRTSESSIELMWNGTAFDEFGSTSALKSLAFKDPSDIETGGSTSKALVTTSITGVSGSTTVTGVDGSTTVTGVDGSTSVYGCGDNTTVHDTPSLGTTNIYGCGDNTTVHDTPSLGTTNIYGCGDNATIKEVDTVTAGTAPSMSYDENSRKLTFSPGSVTAVSTKNTTVATKAAEATAVGTSIVAGTEVTVATKAAEATAVGTSIVAGTEVTVATKASSATTVPVAAAAATTVPVAADAATTVPTAASSATTVATGAVANSDASGASVITAVSTTIQNKA